MMTNKDLRRFARERWRKFWPTVLAAFVLLFSVYIALAMGFSFVLSPFLLTSFLPGIEELRRGISLSISGILLALLGFVLVMYLIITSFSILYMALKSIRGQKLSPFDIFYTLRPENYPMQLRVLAYSLLYTAIPWLFSFMTFFLFGSSANNPILSMAEEVFFNVLIGVFLMFFLCTPFLLLETKSIGLIDAMKKSAEWMKPERARFFRHVLYFLGLRLIANVLAEMWGYILENSILPGFFLMCFFLLFLSPYYILVQAAFYQDILSKKKTEQERSEVQSGAQEEREEETQAAVEAETKEEPGLVVEEERKAESPEFEANPKPEVEPKPEADVEPQAAVEAEPKEEPGLAVEEEPEEEPKTAVAGEAEEEVQTIVEAEDKAVSGEVSDEEPKATAEKELREDPKKEAKGKPEEEPKEELSFEEARKRYTDYKEEEES